MNQKLLITIEIMVVVNIPLIVLFLRGHWSIKTFMPGLLAIPLLWYLTYALLHELGHVAGIYLVGGRVVDCKLIPRFWLGEFGGAWIKPAGITQSWQQLVTTGFPYMLDAACIIVGISVLRRGFSRSPFVVGLVFMLLCLRPAFDFVCESVAFLSGDKGDFDAIQRIIGSTMTWVFISVSVGLSSFSIVTILRRFAGFPEI